MPAPANHHPPTSPLLRAKAAGLSSTALTRMVRKGELERMGRGLYRVVSMEGYDQPDILEASLLVPRGVVVLVSALAFHRIGTHTARAVWMQIPANYPRPRATWPPLEIIRSRVPEAFTAGVEEYEISGHKVRITNPERTIVDCFKHRNKVTLELCLEALRERLRYHHRCLPEIHRYAKLLRVERVMRPYLEAMV